MNEYEDVYERNPVLPEQEFCEVCATPVDELADLCSDCKEGVAL